MLNPAPERSAQPPIGMTPDAYGTGFPLGFVTTAIWPSPRECWIPVPTAAPVPSPTNFLRRDLGPEKGQVPGGFADQAWGFKAGTIREVSLRTAISLRSLGVGRFIPAAVDLDPWWLSWPGACLGRPGHLGVLAAVAKMAGTCMSRARPYGRAKIRVNGRWYYSTSFFLSIFSVNQFTSS